MMENEKKRNIWLGIFVLGGTVLLIICFYFLGRNQNLLGSKIRLSATFTDVGGLTRGSNVRYAGINVGTVESVDISNDTTIIVKMVLEERAQTFIRKSSRASLGTDGLMGNKLVNIEGAGDQAPFVSDGDVLASVKPVEVDQMIRTLNVTNDNMMRISHNLRAITDRINTRNNLWNMLLDTVVAENVKSAIVNFRVTSANALSVTGDLSKLSAEIRRGKGSIGALITDTILSSHIRQTVVRLKNVTDSSATVVGDLSQILRHVNEGRGSLGVLLKDTSLVHNLNRSIRSIDTGAVNFNENMEALQHTWPLKKYFRRKQHSGR